MIKDDVIKRNQRNIAMARQKIKTKPTTDADYFENLEKTGAYKTQKKFDGKL